VTPVKPKSATPSANKPRTALLLPRWLGWLLLVTLLTTAVAVSSLVVLTATAYWERPLNPLDSNPQAIAAQPELLNLNELFGTNPNDPNLPPAVLTEIVAQNQPVAIPTLDSTDRINILVMGIDRRTGEPYISRTDSMMILSIDPATNRAAMLSIPRDLYVTIPNYGQNRINTAFLYGAQNGRSPADGAQLAMQTVSYNLGLPIHHYLTVDFSTFVTAIDTLGGIQVDVPYTIYDSLYPDMNYGYDPFYITAGTHQLDGETALKYARTRHSDSDFHRAARQQQIVMAVRERILAQGLQGLIQQGPFLFQQIEDGIRTDMSLSQILALASAASQVPSENIESMVIDSNYVTPYTTPGGASVLILQGHLVAPIIQQMFQ
jgi:polyisoprenyl-teichoic acid--peptidoglycan teichoic acid transferase